MQSKPKVATAPMFIFGKISIKFMLLRRWAKKEKQVVPNKHSLRYSVQKKDLEKQPAAITFFFDYNTVELALLFCAVLVCLAGVMFESDRFKATDGSGSLRYVWQRDLVTFIVIFIVFSSFVYLAIVMLNEITGYTPRCLKNCCQKKENAMMSAANAIQNHKDDQIEMSILNPSMINAAATRPSVVGRLEAETNAMAKERVKLEEMIASQKQSKKAIHNNSTKKMGRGKKSGKKSNKKKDFGAKVTEVTLTDEELLAIGAASLSDTVLSAKNEEIKSINKNVRQKKKQSFHHHLSDTGQDYYSNLETNETTWKLPKDAILVETVRGDADTMKNQTKNPYLGPKKQGSTIVKGEETKNPTREKKKSFRRLKTSENGREYYQNVDQPEVTTWTVPGDAEVV